MQTYTGRQYWPLDPRPDEVHLEDIAHHLSMLCRYNGACERFYSVAEHSVNVMFLVPPELHLAALLHDATEAYLGDMIRPIKRNSPEYVAVEKLNHAVICERFGIDPSDCEVIKQADSAMLVAEAARLLKKPPADWLPVDVPDDMQRAAHGRIAERMEYHVYPPLAQTSFLQQARALGLQ